MAITLANQLAIAYKKLVGKSHSTIRAGAIEEPFASAVQLGSSEIFAQDPTSIKTYKQNGDIATEDHIGDLASLYTFNLISIASSEYNAVINQSDTMKNEGELALQGKHGFRLQFGSTQDIPADLRGKYLDQDIKLQLVPPKYGPIYNAKVFAADGTTVIEPDGAQDWSLDYYSGILFVQDLVIAQVPTTLKAYFYKGKYISDIITETQEDNEKLVKGQLERLDVRKDEDSAPQFSNLGEPEVPVTVATFSGSVGVSGDLEVNGTLHTKKLIVEETTQVVTKTNYANENIFGDQTSEGSNTRDTHTFYGDVNINGNLSVTGDGPNKKKVFEITRENAADDNGYISLNFDSPPVALQDIKKGNLFLINTLDDDNDTNDEIEIRLPDISNTTEWNGIEYTFKHMCGENHTVSISAAEGEGQQIDGGFDVFLHAQYESITIVAYNGNWHIV